MQKPRGLAYTSVGGDTRLEIETSISKGSGKIILTLENWMLERNQLRWQFHTYVLIQRIRY